MRNILEDVVITKWCKNNKSEKHLFTFLYPTVHIQKCNGLINYEWY